MTETVYSLFEQTAEQQKDAPAVIEDGRTLTYGELCGTAGRIADGFPEGIKRVGIIMDHRAEMIAAMLAVLKRGAAYVPAEPDFPAGRIREMMSEADIDFIITEKAYADKLAGFALRFADDVIRPGGNARGCAASSDSPAYILYTSGTTGRPKGVCVTNANVCRYARAFAAEFAPKRGDVTLQYSVCTFDIFVEEVFASLLNGAAVAVPGAGDKADIRSLMEFVKRRNVTIISGFPYLLAEMNRLPEIPGSLRLLISGGDVLRGSYVDRLLPQATVYNTYGPSETTVCAAYYRCNGGAVLPDGTYPIGKPITGAEIRILDSDGREAAPGEVGEICIYGGGVSLGYIGSHDAENRAFETAAGGRMYRSGDMGRVLPDGNIAFLHRKDTQIMIYGKRVEISEVESRLCRCGGVEQAVVRAFTDDNGLPYMTAYIVPARPDVRVSDIRRELAETLPPFMIPEFFVKTEQIPLNSNGKPDAGKLPVVMKAGDTR